MLMQKRQRIVMTTFEEEGSNMSTITTSLGAYNPLYLVEQC